MGQRHDLISSVVHGALGGATGAACMTPLRLAARRLGIVEEMTPQAVEESLAARLGLGRGARPELHHTADQLLHLAFGAALGTAYALATERSRRSSVGRGVVFGALAWVVGAGAVMPLLRAARPPWTARAGENLVNLAAHLLFGITTALTVEEQSIQRAHGPSSDLRRYLRRVG